MDTLTAIKIIESLREGIPPEGYVAKFTVGRKEEVDELHTILKREKHKALLLKANYGSGKTHLLKLIKEMALSENYVVSLIALDSNSAVRFNRMDQIFGQICRMIEIPNKSKKGIGGLFDTVCANVSKTDLQREQQEYISNLTNDHRWDYSTHLESPAIFIALRAWFFGDINLKAEIEDWLFNPWKYKTIRKKLYNMFIERLRQKFRDPRQEWQFYDDQVFIFHAQGYRQSWDALNDFDKIAKGIGYRGLIILVDEFEDVITNLRNRNHQLSAFWNLFQFFSGSTFRGLSFFAVTPGFVKKCKELLINKGYIDYDYSRFDKLKAFEMTPLSQNEVIELSKKIIPVYQRAYDCIISDGIKLENAIQDICRKSMQVPIQDRVRLSIKNVVKRLDTFMEETNGQ